MLLYSNMSILLGNVVTLRRIYSILFIWVIAMILLNTGLMECDCWGKFGSCKDTGIGVYRGLFRILDFREYEPVQSVGCMAELPAVIEYTKKKTTNK